MDSTNLEIDFIKKIGTFSVIGRKTSKRCFLTGYLEGCKKRINWDDLDKDKIIKFVESELRSLNENPNPLPHTTG